MNTLDTRDLIDERDGLKKLILDDFNDKFNTEFDNFDEIILDKLEGKDFEYIDRESIIEFKKYWEEEYEKIEEIDNLEDEINSREWNYGITLIDEDDFEDYCKELVEECGYITKDFPSWIGIDWKSTTNNITQDYSVVKYEKVNYLYR